MFLYNTPKMLIENHINTNSADDDMNNAFVIDFIYSDSEHLSWICRGTVSKGTGTLPSHKFKIYFFTVPKLWIMLKIMLMTEVRFNMKGKRIILIILFIVIFVGTWNLLDLGYSTFITRSGYQFGLVDDMLLPVLLAVVLDYPL